MAVKPTAPRVMSGTYGTLYWNGDMIFEVSSFEAKLKVNRETISFAGDLMENSKLMGLAGEWSFKLNKIYSRAKDLAVAMKKGLDPRAQFIGTLADPDAFGSEKIVLNDCWFGDLILQKFENKKLTEDEFSGGFGDFDFVDAVKPN